jgi:ABC-type antimicrobial peptide transport system permease subunit
MQLAPSLVVLSAMGLLVLMIACANIAGLVLVRGVSRRGEIAVRLALGATRTRIVRLLIVENLVLALPGAILGVVLASRGVPLLVGYAEALAAPRHVFFNVGVDRLVNGFAVLVACGSALVFGFVPALQSSRVDLVTVINQDASPRARRAVDCVPASSSHRSRCRCSCSSAPALSRGASRPHVEPTPDTTRCTRRQSRST